MAFTTKIDLNSSKVYQGDNELLTLSGDTVIAAVGTLKYAVHPTLTGSTQLTDKQYVDTCVSAGVSGGTIYNLGSPAAVTVGGITPSYVLTGKSTNCILQDMLYPELCGTLTAPSMTSLVLAPSTSPLEVGTVIGSLSVTANFSQGSINPQYCSASPNRSGAANCYCFTGAVINGLYACTANAATKTVTGHTVTLGANTWGARTCYDAGVQPKSNKNQNFSTPLSAGIIGSLCENTITGIYPYYFGQVTCATRPAVTNALITGGTKCQLNAGTCTSVIYSAVGQWTWFALPAACAARAYWCETALSRGTIGNPTDKYPDTCNISISSGQACWAGVSYNVYMSGTVGTVNTIALSSYLLP
jgi:hypothetical protein